MHSRERGTWLHELEGGGGLKTKRTLLRNTGPFKKLRDAVSYNQSINGCCEGYSGIWIRSDDPYIRNVASGGAPYILCGYMQSLELKSTQYNDSTHTDESNDPVTSDRL